jgi:hypothetical protein
MSISANFLSQLHALWWIVLLVVCIGAAVAILFGIAIEAMKPEPPAPPYRIEFDDFYIDDRKG